MLLCSIFSFVSGVGGIAPQTCATTALAYSGIQATATAGGGQGYGRWLLAVQGLELEQ